jgi:hypothetical protein
MDTTPRLALPYLQQNQAQKHVTLNDALRRLDALVQMHVLSAATSGPPASPADGDAYLLPAEPLSADWSIASEGQLAVFQDGTWEFLTPRTGWLVFDAESGALLLFDGSGWTNLSDRSFSKLGINTDASDTNRLSVKADAELLSHDDVTPGSGDARKIINKADISKTASVLFQTGFSGRAEFGLTGSEDFQLKVSADGSSWTSALEIANTDGAARFPAGVVHTETGLPVAHYIPSPVAELWRLDTLRLATPRSYTLDGASGTTLTLSSTQAGEIFGPGMRGNAAVRIWNVTKAPAEPAWIDYDLSATELRVTDAAHVAGWSPGDTLQLGDPSPTGTNSLNMVAIDISGYLASKLGTVFQQKGLMLGFYVSSATGPAGIDVSPDGSTGSATGGNALVDGTRNSMSLPVPTVIASPISNSNLLFLREGLVGGASDIGVSFLRVLGVYV